jgi:hypothetical protein
VDSIAELDLLWSIGVSVAAGHTRVCGMADSGHRLHVKQREGVDVVSASTVCLPAFAEPAPIDSKHRKSTTTRMPWGDG